MGLTDERAEAAKGQMLTSEMPSIGGTSERPRNRQMQTCQIWSGSRRRRSRQMQLQRLRRTMSMQMLLQHLSASGSRRSSQLQWLNRPTSRQASLGTASSKSLAYGTKMIPLFIVPLLSQALTAAL